MENVMQEPRGLATEMTLKSAINELNELSWQLNGMIFGERPAKEAEVPTAQNSLVELRNKVMESNKRIKEVLQALRLIK